MNRRGVSESFSQRKPSQRIASDHVEGAIRFLARRDRTEAQLRAYLSRAGATPSQTQAVVKSLLARGYVNDEAYASKWARARLARRPMGRERLEAELHGQGIDSATAARTLDIVYGEINERDLARKLLAGNTGNPGLLRRRGFSEETIETLFGAAPDEQSVVGYQRSVEKG